MTKVFFFSCILWVGFGFGFIPPVNSLIRDAFEGRKTAPAVEVVFRHRFVGNADAEDSSTDLEERVFLAGGRVYTFVKSGGVEVGGFLDKGSYVFADQKRYPHRSPSWLRYWISSNSDDWREQLINERFVRRDFLQQFRPTFEPAGDPAGWESAENYLRQPDIFFSRSAKGLVTIALQGQADSSSGRTIYFDRELQGPRRWEWREGGEVYSWNLDLFKKIPGQGTFAGRLIYRVQERDRIVSEMVSRRSLKDKQWADISKNWGRASKVSVSPSLDESLRLLLSYR